MLKKSKWAANQAMSVEKALTPAGRKSRSPSHKAVEDTLVLHDTCCANEESEHGGLCGSVTSRLASRGGHRFG